MWTIAIGVVTYAISYPRALSMSTMEPFLKLALATLAIAGVLSLALRRRVIRPAFLRQGSLGHGVPWTAVAFLTFAANSVLWTDQRRVTATAVIFYTAIAVLAYLVASAAPARVLVRGIGLGAALVVGTSYLAVGRGTWQTSRELGWAEDTRTVFQGLYGHWNILAFTICLLIPAVLTYRPQTLLGRVLQLPLAVGAIAFTVPVGSATGMIAAAASFGAAIAVAAVGWLVRTHRRPRTGRRWLRLLITYVGVVVATTLATVAGYLAVTRVPAMLDKDVETLTERVPMWRVINEVWRDDHTWHGFGLGNVWPYHWFHTGGGDALQTIKDRFPLPVGHGHNGFLDLAIQLGIVGAFLYLVILVRAALLALHQLLAGGSQTSSWVLVTIATITVLSVTEPIWMTPLGWFLAVAAATAAEREHVRRGRPGPAHQRRREPVIASAD
ncbi:hypothetical protein GCM10011331_23230 [Flavimobilis marinus]|uniref:O-antigen ligase n=1 Tax=Flavimobilis marinus TaxID=285351 RepID=A0A1I2GMN8_9MICO|nr:O-antigen ligase family protein [Flavimobilis marinus]GHG56073.1 hypothetical protein GCM10011331_23230 [Flavimobilis marinus]SFF18270.1 O-antigen ligase [Flavimobilis marinus]